MASQRRVRRRKQGSFADMMKHGLTELDVGIHQVCKFSPSSQESLKERLVLFFVKLFLFYSFSLKRDQSVLPFLAFCPQGFFIPVVSQE